MNKARSVRMVGTLVALCLTGGSGPLFAQETSERVPEAARRLIVSVTAAFGEGEAQKFGAGIITAVRSDTVYVATARHVLQHAGLTPVVNVRFPGRAEEVYSAELVPGFSSDLDLSALAVYVGGMTPPFQPPRLDRLGDFRKLKSPDPVYPVGCPQNQCWQTSTGDQVIGVSESVVIFATFFVERGSSGGGLFNESFEVVGMVRTESGSSAEAIPIDYVIAEFTADAVPVDLHKPRFPRSGYSNGLAAVLLVPSEGEAFPDGRFPSGRVTYSHPFSSIARSGGRSTVAVRWQASAMRLTADNLSVNAATVGLGLVFRTQVLKLAPFGEFGVADQQGRFDAGGFLVPLPGGGFEDVPFWEPIEDTSFGFGVGLEMDLYLFKHVAIELVGGHWDFDALLIPDNVPEGRRPVLADFYFGGFLKLGF